jgi:hypothetical protein
VNRACPELAFAEARRSSSARLGRPAQPRAALDWQQRPHGRDIRRHCFRRSMGDQGKIVMRCNRYIGALALVASACVLGTSAMAFDESKYPDWEGAWRRSAGVQWDPSKPTGPAQQAPLTSEYQKIYDDNLKDQALGGPGTDMTYTCIPDGMPRAMNVVMPMEIVVKANVTYIMIEYFNMLRRVYTDGRGWPKNAEPSFMGYSIGKWVDDDGDGRYDALEIETRNLKGPRVFEPSGIPLHADDETVVQERIYLDKNDPNVLHDKITTIDHALTRPWIVDKTYVRDRNPVWVEFECAERNDHVHIGNEAYMLSADGMLMPAKKGQPAPDLKYFKPAQK